jgi:hypothetical protein
MESVSDVRSKQRAVIEGFWGVGGEAEMEYITNIHKRLTNVLETLQWIKALSAVGESDWHR